MKRKIYLAYGSNMSLQQMYHRCPDAEPIGKGILKGWRLMFKGSQSGNYATIEKEEGCEVPVVAWAISSLDVYLMPAFGRTYSFTVYDSPFCQKCKGTVVNFPCGAALLDAINRRVV